MNVKHIFFAILVGAGASTAIAAEIEDANGDGVYSIDEVMVTFPDLTEELFGQLDMNGDGALDDEEIAAGESAGLLVAG